MKKNTLEGFREELLRTGAYMTAPECRAPRVRRPGMFTTLGFSTTVFNVFPRCGIAEMRGKLTTDLWAHICWAAAQKIEAYGGTFTCDGWNNRRDNPGPVVYLSNHMSTLETVLLPPIVLTYGPFNVVVKASLSHLPFLENAATHMGLIPLTRTSPREDLMRMFTLGADCIKQGHSILIFPQGSREKVFSSKMFSSIGAKLAEKAGAPIVPIAVQTDIEPTRPGGPFKDFGPVDPSRPVRIRCGAPIPVTNAREMHRATFDWMATQLREWGLPVEG